MFIPRASPVGLNKHTHTHTHTHKTRTHELTPAVCAGLYALLYCSVLLRRMRTCAREPG